MPPEKELVRKTFCIEKEEGRLRERLVLPWMTKHWNKLIFPFHVILIFHLLLKVGYFRKSAKKVPQF